jgi:hypothetical protein
MSKRQSIKSELLRSAEKEADIVIASHNMAMRPTFKCLNPTLPKLKLLYIVRELNGAEIDQLTREMEEALGSRLDKMFTRDFPALKVIRQADRTFRTRENFVDGFNRPAHFTDVLSPKKS